MILDSETAKNTAALLLQINAIKLRPENPFSWASGWKSPIYCDNRIILSHPEARKYVSKQMAEQLTTLYNKPDAIAGVATGAIGMGLMVAEILDLPFVYVRPEAKSHGRQNKIEGQLEKGASVVVIEDLISTGNSSLKAVEALNEHGAQVLGMLAIFTYGFDTASKNFSQANTSLHTLSHYEALIAQAIDSGRIEKDQLNTLQEWRKNPAQWKQTL
ncbi:MAG: orotate phosphoribosyltransferase [Flavobacteriaceae bacterium]|nr:orotate phosphoribosyltransferase [Flavobacteriaceae bacterium]MCI5089064.1 orotate phosphoribosyltransferase [Flavobacteriaceae bacterium]